MNELNQGNTPMTQFNISGSFNRLFILFLLALCTSITTMATAQDESPEQPSSPNPSASNAAENADEASTEASSPQDDGPNSILGVDLNAIDKFARKMQNDRKYSRISEDIIDLMSPVIASFTPSTVRIYSENKQVAIGSVIDPNGLILTVGSELKSPIECRMPDGSTLTATVFGLDAETGLAMLKVDAQSLTSLPLNDQTSARIGDWLASVSPDRHPISIGVVSVLERLISGGNAFIGIRMLDHPKGVRIDQVVAGSPAEKADMLVNDVITSVGGKTVSNREEVRAALQEYSPGDSIEIIVIRKDQERSFQLILAASSQFQNESNEQNKMGSVLSRRRQGFEKAFQHDSFLQANECGSPLVNIDGQIVGINISRSGRVSTLAIPMSVVLPAIERLKSGELIPSKVNAKRIEIVERELADLETEAIEHPKKILEIEASGASSQGRIEELKATIASLQKRLEDLEKQSQESSDQIEALKSKSAQREVRKRRLSRELEQLKLGTQN